MQPHAEQSWQVHDRFLELHSRWMTLIGEHLQDNQGQVLEYWRIEKADSVIVLPIQGNQILLPAPSYRPGVGQSTLDFPGGRMLAEQNSAQTALAILKRELDIDAASVTQLIPLNSKGWAVNSSFSNQNLYGFVAHIETPPQPAEFSTELVAETYPVTAIGVQNLLQKLNCLQCRTVLLEWWMKQNSSS